MTVSFVISVSLSAWNNSAPTGWIFLKFLYLSIFRKPLKKIQVSFKSNKNNGWFTWRPIYMFDHILLYSSWNDKCFFRTKLQRRSKYTFLFNTFFGGGGMYCYETMRKNIVELGRPEMTIWRMPSACWIAKVANTHSKYIILVALPLQQWLHKHSSM